jgi:SAM-dependent methyltransferase
MYTIKIFLHIITYMRIKSLIINKLSASILLKPLLLLDNKIYKLISRLSVIYNNGEHPKHSIINYTNWFIANTQAEDIIYEIGSHQGQMSRALSNHVKRIYAIEIDPNSYEVAIKKKISKSNIKFILGDATKTTPPKDKIDKIILSNVLEHINDRIPFLKSIIDNCDWKNEVKVLIRVPLITRDWVSCYKKQLGLYYFLDPTHFIEYTEEELRKEIDAAGLKIKSFKVHFGEAYVSCYKEQ